MKPTVDGPCSRKFSPPPFQGNTSRDDLQTRPLSPELLAALPEAPHGSCICWGIPFEIERVVLLDHDPFEIAWEPVEARWLIFMHTSDYVPTRYGRSSLTPSEKGPGRNLEIATRYTLRYTDGTQVTSDIRRNYQVGPFQRHWGISCCEAVVHYKPFPVHVHHEQVTILEQIEGALAFIDTIGTRATDNAYKRMRLVLTSAHRRLHNRMHEQGFEHIHTHVTTHN